MLIAHVAGLPVEEALPAVPALVAGAWLVVARLRMEVRRTLTRPPRA